MSDLYLKKDAYMRLLILYICTLALNPPFIGFWIFDTL